MLALVLQQSACSNDGAKYVRTGMGHEAGLSHRLETSPTSYSESPMLSRGFATHGMTSAWIAWALRVFS